MVDREKKAVMGRSRKAGRRGADSDRGVSEERKGHHAKAPPGKASGKAPRSAKAPRVQPTVSEREGDEVPRVRVRKRPQKGRNYDRVQREMRTDASRVLRDDSCRPQRNIGRTRLPSALPYAGAPIWTTDAEGVHTIRDFSWINGAACLTSYYYTTEAEDADFCPLCAAGVCVQRVERIREDLLVVHGKVEELN